MHKKEFNFTAIEEDEGERLDKFLAAQSLNLSRTYLKKLIQEKSVLVNGRTVKPSYNLRVGDVIELTIPPPEEIDIKPEDISLKIAYEDEYLLVVDKKAGMVVHPSPGHYSGTLVNALLYHCKLSSINGILRPGIIHRLDRDTSGLLVVAKEDRAHLCLVEDMQNRNIKRKYKVVVHGIVTPPQGRIDAPIGRHPYLRQKMAVVPRGKEAITIYKVIKTFDNYSLLDIELLTGRTHQIRVHMAYKGYPVVGDTTYGHSKKDILDKSIGRQALHAYELRFTHPITREKKVFNSHLPDDIKQLLTR